MMISSKGKYAVRVLAQLASDGGQGEFVALKQIAQKQQISLKYSESIMARLSKAGFVEAASGRGGGYRLTKAPSQYSLSEILRAAEDTIEPVSCGGGAHCENYKSCCTFPIWNELGELISNFLDSKTLADVAANISEEYK